MTTETIIANTKQMIDDLKTVCANFGLGNASSEYKITKTSHTPNGTCSLKIQYFS